jgi:hypothetical protein
MELSSKYPERGRIQPGPYDDFCYAEALLRWEKQGTAEDYFSTEDKFILEFRKEIQDKFGLEILTPEEAKLRSGNTLKVTGIPKYTNLLN